MIQLKNKIKTAPKNPGCYLFKNKDGDIIYIGKAKNLRQRVNWYFKIENQIDKSAELAKNIVDVEFIVTDSEIEALLLEAQLIKRNQPKYNIDLKGDSRYAFVKFTEERFPRLITVRNPEQHDKVFGPYTSGASRQEIIRLANRLFKIRIGKKLSVKDETAGRIKLATAPWTEQVAPAEYAKRIELVRLLLKGKSVALVKKLSQEMNDFSAKQNFELAKSRRDQIKALANIDARQKVQRPKNYNQDVINYLQVGDKFFFQLFNINKGVISGRQEFTLVFLENDLKKILSDFIRQYYFNHDCPPEIILPHKINDQPLVAEYLSILAKQRIKFTIPIRGDKLKLLELLKKNIIISVSSGDRSLFELQQKLGLSKLPNVIECFDVSNLGATGVVAAMVQFRGGKPDKNNYRKFKIKTVRGQSDFASMREVVLRRYYRITKEQSAWPDLIMVDGGKPQLSAATQALKILGLTWPLIALAKKEEEIFTKNSKYSIRLDKKSDALKLLQRIRNEAHRFAITYQRLVRNKQIR
ncbi:MAG: excinuclease ABC subunit UvrC [Patescibacteria group bacterium]|nr:excinuclease ABC subunit UvrC [Patescibacteria group bacterium]